MSTTMTLAELRTAARQRADMVNSQFVTDAELTSYINQSYFELYDLLVQSFGDDYFVASPYAVTPDGTSTLYSLPTDFYKLLGVDLAISAGANAYTSLKPFSFSERNRFANPSQNGPYGLRPRYRLNGNQIWFTPTPMAGQGIRLWYIPRLTPLALDSDIMDGISGWTEYPIIDAAMKCLQKEESDVSVLMAEKAALIARIQSAASHRDAGQVATVADTRQGPGFGYGHFEGEY